jgi:hypothetical protein
VTVARHVGQRVPRAEDKHLLTGQGGADNDLENAF